VAPGDKIANSGAGAESATPASSDTATSAETNALDPTDDDSGEGGSMTIPQDQDVPASGGSEGVQHQANEVQGVTAAEGHVATPPPPPPSSSSPAAAAAKPEENGQAVAMAGVAAAEKKGGPPAMAGAGAAAGTGAEEEAPGVEVGAKDAART